MTNRARRSEGEDTNLNTEWIGKKGWWGFYIILLIACRILLGALLVTVGISDSYAMLGVHILHTIITFVIIHWSRGVPFWLVDDQGKYDDLTFWEQIDNGRQYTRNRKLMTLVPIILSIWAAYSCDWKPNLLFVNFVALMFVIVPKLGSLHKVRLFGINK